MSKKILETIVVNGIDVHICSDGNNYFTEYNSTTKPIKANTYFMLNIYKELDPMFSYLEDKDLHGEEFSNKEKDLYNNYINEAKRLRCLK